MQAHLAQLKYVPSHFFAFWAILLLFVSACTSKPLLPEEPVSRQGLFQEPKKFIQPLLAEKTIRQPQTITLTAVGDIMLGTDYPDDRLAPNDGKTLLSNVASLLSEADITFGNLEGTFGTAGTAEKACPDVRRCYVFRMPPRYAHYLKDAGFDVVSLANNHARDFGDSGRLLTMQVLDNAGIKHSGLAGDVAQWKLKGLDISLIAFAPFRGSHDFLDRDYVRETIESLAAQNDIVIVSFHGGAEGTSHTRVPFETEYYYGENRGDVVLFAHTVIDAGADVVLGHGPHVPRALELYKGKIIAYSLGNFCTTLGINVAGINGLAPVLSIKIDKNGDFKSGKITSTRQLRPNGPVIDPQHRAAKLIKRLTEEDFPATRLEIDANGNISHKDSNKDHKTETKSDKVGSDSVK